MIAPHNRPRPQLHPLQRAVDAAISAVQYTAICQMILDDALITDAHRAAFSAYLREARILLRLALDLARDLSLAVAHDGEVAILKATAPAATTAHPVHNDPPRDSDSMADPEDH